MKNNVIIFEKKKLLNNLNYSKLKNLKNKIYKQKKIIIVRGLYINFVDKIIKEAKNRSRNRPYYFKPYFKCSDQFIYNKNFKESKVRGYYKKILFFPWNKENKFFFSKFDYLIKLKKKLISDKFSENRYNVIQVMNYPAKKGYLSTHKDSNFHRECIFQITTNESKKKSKSGLNVIARNKKINLESLTKKGDLIIFSKGLKHFVKNDLLRPRWSIILGDFLIT